jgi:hypothetical protein
MPMAAICHTPRRTGRERTGGTGQTKQPDPGLGVVVRSGIEKKRQCRPEDAETGITQSTVQLAQADRWVLV